MPAGEAARVTLRSLFGAVLGPAPAVLAGDVRAVHDMRVAIRRLRSAMATFSEHFPKRRWRGLLHDTRRLGNKLGEVRDADVHLAVLRAALSGCAAADRPGVAYAIEVLLVRRRRALGEFAIELSQFDRDAFTRTLADG
jgi:CHAD domain-containing protein